MKQVTKLEFIIDNSLPTWYEQKLELEKLVEAYMKKNKGYMSPGLAGLVLTNEAMIDMYQEEMRRVYKNLDRDIELTLDMMSGMRLKALKEKYGISISRGRTVMEKVFNLSLALTEGRHNMPDHEYWKICEARWYSDYWIARVKQLKDMMS